MPLTELAGTGRVTVFPLDGLTVAYTTRSSDSRNLGDIGVVATLDVPYSEGEELWKLAEYLGGRTALHEQARWILTQASRARMTATGDRPRAPWTAAVHRRHTLAALYANHDILLTGRMTLLDR